eukprot:1771854-Rhodomonas_salina.3
MDLLERSQPPSHHHHDHHAVIASVPSALLPPALERDKTVRYRRLDMRQWESIRPEWFAYLQSHGPGIAAQYPTATL